MNGEPLFPQNSSDSLVPAPGFDPTLPLNPKVGAGSSHPLGLEPPPEELPPLPPPSPLADDGVNLFAGRTNLVEAAEVSAPEPASTQDPLLGMSADDLIVGILALPPTMFWAGATTGGAWNNPNNWSRGGVIGGPLPGPTDTVSIPSGVTVNFTSTTGTVTVDGIVGGGNLNVLGGTLTITTEAELGTLTFSSGTIQGTGAIAVNTLNWSGGTLSGTGTTTVTTALSMTGTSKSLTNRRLVTPDTATTTWSAGDLFVNGSEWENNGLLELREDVDISFPSGSASFTLRNTASGRIVKSVGRTTTASDRSLIDGTFINEGLVEVSAGRLETGPSFAGTPTDPARLGNITVGAGAILRLSRSTATYLVAADKTVSGAGRVEFAGGTVTIAGVYNVTGSTSVEGATVNVTGELRSVSRDSVLLVSNGQLNLSTSAVVPLSFEEVRHSGGTITGSNSIITRDYLWSGGTLSGASTTTVTRLLSMTGNSKSLINRRLVTPGTTTWSGGDLSVNGSEWENSGLLELREDVNMSFASGSASFTLRNTASGRIVKSVGRTAAATDRSLIDGTFINEGLVEVSAGRLETGSSFAGTPTDPARLGNITVGAGAILRLSRSTVTYLVAADKTVSGAGRVEFAGGTVTIAGVYNVTGSTSVEGATVNVTGELRSVSREAVFTVSGGELNLSTSAVVPLSFEEVRHSGGTITGSNSIITRDYLWSGGTLSGASTTTVTRLLSMTGNSKSLINRRLVTPGTATTTWSGGDLSVNGSEWENSGLLELREDVDISFASGAASFTLRNTASGRIVKSVGRTAAATDRSLIDGTFINEGLVEVSAGRLETGPSFAGTAANPARLGNVRVGTGAILRLSRDVTYLVAADQQIEGQGQLDIASGTLNVAGQVTIATLTFSNGTLDVDSHLAVTTSFTWSGNSILGGDGVTHIAPGATLTIASTRTLASGHTLNNLGTVNLSSVGITATGAVINNQGTFNFTNTSTATLTGGVFTNQGTLAKLGSGNVTFSNVTLNNAGTITSTVGTIQVSGTGFGNVGNFVSTAGAVPPTVTIGSNATVTLAPALPNLEFAEINAPQGFTPGAAFSVSWRLRNTGGASTVAALGLSGAVYLSTDPGFEVTDRFLGRVVNPALAAQTEQTTLNSLSFTIPADFIATLAYLIFVADDRYRQFEGSETNNSAVREIRQTSPVSPPTALVLSGNRIDENSAAGSVIGTLITTDADSTEFQYALVPGVGSTDNALFRIDGRPEGAVLVLLPSPNFEAKPFYSVRVRTADERGLFFEQSFTITVNNLNEAPTALALANVPVDANLSIDENLAAGTIIGTFVTTDPDNPETFTHSLVPGPGDTDNAAFEVDGSALRIRQVPNFESKSAYQIRVQTRDSGNLMVERSLTITIRDLAEAPTALTLRTPTPGEAITLNENVPAGTLVGTFTTSDPDRNAFFTYSLVLGQGDTDNGAFSIVGDRLLINSSPDAETQSSYSIRVRTRDNQGLIFERSFTIAVNDLDEPDLAIALRALPPTTALFGQPIAVSWTVTNVGTSSTNALSWSDRLVISRNAIVGDEDDIFTTTVSAVQFPLLARGGSYVRTVPVTIPIAATFAPGGYNILVQTDVNNVQGELTETNNRIQPQPITLSRPDLPDLRVSRIEPDFPIDLTPGDRFTLTWEVSNGTAGLPLQEWVDRVFLVPATGSTPPVLTSIPSNAIAIGDEFARTITTFGTVSRQITLPSGVPDGNYFLAVMTDPADAIAEQEPTTGGNNNLLVSPRQIAVSRPNLVVTNVTLDQGIPITPPGASEPQAIVTIPGSVPFRVTWTVRNEGGRGSTDTWVDRIIARPLGATNSLSDRVLGEFPHTGFLVGDEPARTYTNQATINLPLNLLSPEQYTLLVQTDARNQVIEPLPETDNSRSAALRLDVALLRYADLDVINATSAQMGEAGQTLPVSWTVTNQGIGTTNLNDWEDRVRFVTDPANPDGTTVASVFYRHFGALAVNGSYSRSVDFPIPNGLSGQFFVVVDAGRPYEFVYTDNNREILPAVTIQSNQNPPDLQVRPGSIIAPTTVRSGDTIDVQWTVQNTTGVAAGSWVDAVGLVPVNDTNATPLLLQRFTTNTSLNAGQEYTRTERITIPLKQGELPFQGGYRLVVITNADVNTPNALTRLYEAPGVAQANNRRLADSLLQVSAPFYPDLQVFLEGAPTQAVAGGSYDIRFRVRNAGVVPTTVPRWLDRVYLTDSAPPPGFFPTGGGLDLGSLGNGAALAPGEEYVSTVRVRIPQNRGGDGFIVVVTDDGGAGGAVPEFPQEGNNVAFVPLPIRPLPPSDLVISDVSLDQTQVPEGGTVTVRYTVTNRGAAPTVTTTGSGWSDTLWLTRTRQRPSPIAQGADGEGAALDIPLRTISRPISLAPGESDYFEETFTLPPFVTGQWYITPWVDAFDVVPEVLLTQYTNLDDPNELDNNNYKASPNRLTITANLASDLTVDQVMATLDPATTSGGDRRLSVNWRVQNFGLATRNSWQDVVYLVGTDGRRIELGRVNNAAALDSATSTTIPSYRSTASFQLPTFFEGVRIEVEADPFSGQPTVGVWEGGGALERNNTNSVSLAVPSLPTNLVVSSVGVVPNEALFSGEGATITWRVDNGSPNGVWIGTQSWQDTVYLSTDPPTSFDPRRATLLGSFAAPVASLRDRNFYEQNQTVRLPRGIGSDGLQYYIYVITNPIGSLQTNTARRQYEGSVFENPNDNRNQTLTTVVYREPDLTIAPPQVTVNGQVVSPTTSRATAPELLSGTTHEIRWSVLNANTGNEGRATRVGAWSDRVYLSRDASLDDTDQLVGSFEYRNGILGVNSSYTGNATIRLPDGIRETDYFLILATDAFLLGPQPPDPPGLRPLGGNVVEEFKNEANNTLAIPINISQRQLPDLQVNRPRLLAQGTQTEISTITIGQSFDLEYTVANGGTGATSNISRSWVDYVYLSRDAVLNLDTDTYLGQVAINRNPNDALDPGESYTPPFFRVNVPSNLTGNYYLLVVTDANRKLVPTGQVFESNEANNGTSSFPIEFRVPAPADVQVTEIDVVSGGKVGEPVQIQWTVTNRGNTAIGRWQDAVYLSTDGAWDVGDRLLSNATVAPPQGNSLALGESYTASTTVLLPAVNPGQYRIIVRTDIFNNLFEGTNEGNNTSFSANPFNVTVDALQVGVPQAIATLSNNQERLYRVDVAAGQTLKVDLTTTNDTAFNELFVRFNAAPTGDTFDFSYQGQLRGDQSLVVPTTQPGSYYILVRGQGNGQTALNLVANLLPFSITDVRTDQGGDSRYVTTRIFGAQFQPNSIVKLVRPGFAEFAPVSFRYVDGTQLIATFDFRNAPRGLYDVKVINPDGQEAIVPYRFLIEEATELNLDIGMGGSRVLSFAPPTNVGRYRVALQNLANVDAPYVFFQFGLPELGGGPLSIPGVVDVRKVGFNSSVGGQPTGLPPLAWSLLDGDVTLRGQRLAPGFLANWEAGSTVGLDFTAHVFQGIEEILARDPDALSGILGDPNRDLSFKFHILAAATPLTVQEFLTLQQQQARTLRQAILQDPSAPVNLVVLAANEQDWVNLYLEALRRAGILRSEDTPPAIATHPNVISAMAIVAAGIPFRTPDDTVGNAVTVASDLVTFFEQVRRWYGDRANQLGQEAPPPASQYDLGVSSPTRFQAFTIYVPHRTRLDLPGFVEVAPPDFSSFFGSATGDLGQLSAITGPLGVGAEQFVPLNQPLPYVIGFQNPADSPTRPGEIRVGTQFDGNQVDIRTFRLGDIRIGDLTIDVPDNVASFQTIRDLSRSRGYILQVTAALDIITNTATWVFRAIDPATGNLVEGAELGLLPPNTSSGNGAGFVSYTIQAKAPPSDSTVPFQIRTQGRIELSNAAPEDTPLLVHTVDVAAPVAQITANQTANGVYQVSWSATDEVGGSGVSLYTVYVAERNTTNYTLWQPQTTATSGVFQGEAGKQYEFVVVATDRAGNRSQPPAGLQVPDDGAGANLGSLPSLTDNAEPVLAPPTPVTGIQRNPLYTAALAAIPSPPSNTRPAEFDRVLSPFRAESFVTGIPQSHGEIGPMAIAVRNDGADRNVSVIISGGPGRNQLFRVGEFGGVAGTPFATLPYPIYDLTLDGSGNLWSTTGGGPLLRLNPDTGAILDTYLDGITQAIAINRTTGVIYVSTGDGVALFMPGNSPAEARLIPYSNLRVGNLAIGPDGSLWGTVWPQRGQIVRFEERTDAFGTILEGRPQLMVSLEDGVDSIAFGQANTALSGLLFISTNNGQLQLVDLSTIGQGTVTPVAIAQGGSRGDILRTTADGRVLLSQSNQVDILSPLRPPTVVATNPPCDATVTLPTNTLTVTFDQAMLVGSSTDAASVLNVNNYKLTLIDNDFATPPVMPSRA